MQKWPACYHPMYKPHCLLYYSSSQQSVYTYFKKRWSMTVDLNWMIWNFYIHVHLRHISFEHQAWFQAAGRMNEFHMLLTKLRPSVSHYSSWSQIIHFRSPGFFLNRCMQPSLIYGRHLHALLVSRYERKNINVFSILMKVFDQRPKRLCFLKFNIYYILFTR